MPQFVKRQFGLGKPAFGFTNRKRRFTNNIPLTAQELLTFTAMHATCYRFIATVVILLCAHTTWAQDPYYTTIDRQSGLPSNAVYALFQDKKGFVWIANDNGLTRYDGFEFKTYLSNLQTSRAGNQIMEDKYGRIWYKNFDGYLYYVVHDTLKALPQHNPISNAGYGLLDDLLVVKQVDSLTFYDLKTLNVVRSIPFDNISASGELCYKNQLFCGSVDTVWKIDPKGNTQGTYVPFIGEPVLSAYGVMLIRTTQEKNRFARFDKGYLEEIFLKEKIGYIQRAHYNKGILWLMTANGLWGYNRQWAALNGGQPYLPDKNLSCMMQDKEGNYWLGTLNEGIIVVPELETKIWSVHGIKPCGFARTGNTMLVYTKQATVHERIAGLDNFRQVFGTAPQHEIYNLAADSSGEKYIVASRQLFITDKKLAIQHKEVLAVKDLVLLDKKYCAFAGSGASGLIRLNEHGTSHWDKQYTAHIQSSSLQYSYFPSTGGRGRTMAYDAIGSVLYLGGSMGTKRIDTNNTTEIRWQGASIYARKLAFYYPRLYILTQQGMLLASTSHTPPKQLRVTEKDEELLGMRRTEKHLYLITTAGIRRLQPQSGEFRFVYIRSGVRPDEINDLEDDGKRLMIATDRGVLFADELETAPATVPGFCINSIQVNGHEVDAANISGLKYGQKDVELRYSILSYGQINKFVLQYRINDGEWQQAERNTRRLKLASIAPGKYSIGFRLVSTDKKIYEQAPVRFVIRQPFWQQGWFWAMNFGASGIIGLLYYRWRTNQLRRKNALIIEKMELENHLRHSTLTAIRAQMNPHFFYNALNTIQSFIFSDDKRNASTYLVKMSKLTRMILEMSDKESVTLEEETEALRLYLELEKIRFGTEFNYTLTIEGNVDTEMLKIPPMIVQPYVENAIKHGLLHKAGNKTLAISFARQDGALTITIDDNGIGRERATELQQQRKEKHQSFSTGANSKRIDLLNREGRRNIGIVYIDKNIDGHATGTTVIITIPIG